MNNVSHVHMARPAFAKISRERWPGKYRSVPPFGILKGNAFCTKKGDVLPEKIRYRAVAYRAGKFTSENSCRLFDDFRYYYVKKECEGNVVLNRVNKYKLI